VKITIWINQKEEFDQMTKGKIELRKVALILAVLGLFAAPAWATQIDFSGIGMGGTWSWNGTGPLSATAQGVELKLVGSSSTFLVGGSPLTFTTGPLLAGGSGTLGSPWMFGPNSPNSFTIMGCIPPATSCSSTATLFSGQFTGNQGVIKGTGNLLFDAPDVSGTVNAGVLSYLGLPSSSTPMSGSFNFLLAGSVPGGLSGSGDLIVGSPVPEPISMALVGTGLLGVGIALRRKGYGVKNQ
jgi:PEP-CTERM motif